jgi:hypothetical protein
MADLAIEVENGEATPSRAARRMLEEHLAS